MKNAVGAVQSALVLGGTSDIGLAVVRRLAKDRLTQVVLAGRSREQLERAAEALRTEGPHVEVTEWDARQDPAAGIERIFDQYADFDAVLMTAGILGDEATARISATVAREIMESNFVGPALALTACGRRLREQGHGTLVVLSSVAGQRPRRSNFVYGSTKAGLDAFAQGLGDELEGSGASVLVVRPGFVRTKMTAHLDAAPLATTPDRVAESIADGLRRGDHTVWVPPSFRFIMAILTILPRPVFRRLNL